MRGFYRKLKKAVIDKVSLGLLQVGVFASAFAFV